MNLLYEYIKSDSRFKSEMKKFDISEDTFHLDTFLPKYPNFTESLYIEEKARKLIEPINILTYHFFKGRTYFFKKDLWNVLYHTHFNYPLSLIKFPFRSFCLAFENGLNIKDLLIDHEDALEPWIVHHCYIYQDWENKNFNFPNIIITFVSNNPDDTKSIWTYTRNSDETFKDLTAKSPNVNVENLANIIFNCITYLTSENADVRWEIPIHPVSSSSKKSKKKKTHKIKNPYFNVGANFKSTINTGISKEGSKHSFRYPVTGHWRNQVYGPRNNPQHRPKWIMPFLRGPETADLIRKIGVVTWKIH